ncbi:hypothetical protein PM3016_3197 [Paenibacillus mucilaginosus 3016]|uniref:DUF2269 family protein n=2 Tax=Paenibacillus mucilaginosus TaxID=61624 RepID=H6NFG6_9BACL|nr:hypothetical protein [Paenibacillus mucilaginosus]AFC30052.1 hypothetical protein PM3016_3197 [Paenibacillus mucilaginosus 3016]AFH62313.1 hypothetical protein B2K_16555 [Paenibacillus mucilaginosus K02]WFA18705.1 hypothetical protein ERY13_16185 [Paenibacillus mucilaginosus]
MFWYDLLVFIHAVSAMVSIGPFFVLIPMLRKLHTAEGPLKASFLDSFHFVVRLSKHTGHVLVGSGLLLMWLGGWPWDTPWILGTFAVLVASLVFMARAFSPTIRKLRQEGSDRAPLLRKLTRSLYIYLTVLFIMLWMMITKPQFAFLTS